MSWWFPLERVKVKNKEEKVRCQSFEDSKQKVMNPLTQRMHTCVTMSVCETSPGITQCTCALKFLKIPSKKKVGHKHVKFWSIKHEHEFYGSTVIAPVSEAIEPKMFRTFRIYGYAKVFIRPILRRETHIEMFLHISVHASLHILVKNTSWDEACWKAASQSQLSSCCAVAVAPASSVNKPCRWHYSQSSVAPFLLNSITKLCLQPLSPIRVLTGSEGSHRE